MALFQSDLKETVRRLSAKDFASPEERDELPGTAGVFRRSAPLAKE